MIDQTYQGLQIIATDIHGFLFGQIRWVCQHIGLKFRLVCRGLGPKRLKS